MRVVEPYSDPNEPSEAERQEIEERKAAFRAIKIKQGEHARQPHRPPRIVPFPIIEKRKDE